VPLGPGPVPRPRGRGNVVAPGAYASLMEEMVVIVVPESMILGTPSTF
jgi:hypothetical protein